MKIIFSLKDDKKHWKNIVFVQSKVEGEKIIPQYFYNLHSQRITIELYQNMQK